MATLDIRPALEHGAHLHQETLQPRRNDSAAPEGSWMLWQQAFLLGFIFGALDLAIHIAINLRAQSVGYGIFRDELYYLVCGRRLAWGYLDNQPLIPLLTRWTDALFGHATMWTFRLVPSLAGAAKVMLTGLLARALGGRRGAQAVAMIAVIGAPEYLAVDSILSMNCLEPVFWMAAMLALLELAKGPTTRMKAAWWITFGVMGGLALETKISGAFFLLCVLAGLLLTPARRLLLDRWAMAGIALIVMIEAPNLVWQWHRDFPTIQWLVAVSHEGKDVLLGPAAFLWQQVLVLDPFSAAIWVAGAMWMLLSRPARQFRFAGLAAMLFIALMLALHAKTYYVVPIYPVLFAAGAVSWCRILPGRWKAAPVVYMAVFATATWYWLPVVLPIVAPSDFAKWEHRLGYRPEETENFREVALPQLLADMTSWPGFVQQVAAAYNSLPAEVRNTPTGQLGIFATNYGEASAIDVYGGAYGLPPAISGHQNYWYWGPRDELRNAIVVVGQRQQDIQKTYATVQAIGKIHAPYAMPFEDGATIWLAQGRLKSPDAIWKSARELY